MTTLAIRKKLAAYMQVADDKKVKAMYALLETDLKENETVSIEQYNEELEKADNEIAKGNYITHNDLLKRKQLSKITKR
jgi:hypothetical protein